MGVRVPVRPSCLRLTDGWAMCWTSCFSAWNIIFTWMNDRQTRCGYSDSENLSDIFSNEQGEPCHNWKYLLLVKEPSGENRILENSCHQKPVLKKLSGGLNMDCFWCCVMICENIWEIGLTQWTNISKWPMLDVTKCWWVWVQGRPMDFCYNQIRISHWPQFQVLHCNF